MSSFNLIEGLRIFRKVVDAGSITGAARDLEFSVTWTAKNVERLEAHLGVTLLLRTTRRIRLTEAGALCYEMSGRLLDDAGELETILGQDVAAPKGVLKISAPVSFAICELGPAVADFAAAYPEIRLELNLSDRFVDVMDEGFDLALRLSSSMPDSRLLARKLGTVRRITCAAPSYLAANGVPASPEELMSHNCLIFSLLSQRNTWPFRSKGRTIEIHPPANLVANNSLLIRAALIAGTGIALIPDFIVRDDILAGTIVPLLSEFEPEPFDLFLVRPADRRQPRRVSMFIDFLVANLPSLRVKVG